MLNKPVITIDEYKEKGMTCVNCDYWTADVDCGHTDPNHEICGDFYEVIED